MHRTTHHSIRPTSRRTNRPTNRTANRTAATSRTAARATRRASSGPTTARLSGVRFASVLAAVALVGSACGTTSETSTGSDDASASVDDASFDSGTSSQENAGTENSIPSAEATADPTERNASVSDESTTSTESDPASDAAGNSDPEADADSDPDESDPDPAPDAELDLGLGTDQDPGPDPAPSEDPGDVADPASTPAEPAADCGTFGPIPPVPDSMPTEMYDTDGDGVADDAVTAYGAGTWLLRIVENGVISEAAMPDISGWAYISNDYKVHGRDFIEVTDNDLGTIYTFATVEGCTELLDVRTPGVDLAPAPSPAPVPEPPSDLTATPGACGDFGDGPPFVAIASEIFVDLTGDGTTDDQVITYGADDGTWKMRATVGGVASEVEIDGVGPGWAQILGLADVGEVTPGDEIIATVGATPSQSLIGIFGIDESGCLFRFVNNADEPLVMYFGASIGHGSQFFCGTGYVGQEVWSLEDDGTYYVSGYALIESSPGRFTYMPASDGYAEGVVEADLPTNLIDCDGLTL